MIRDKNTGEIRELHDGFITLLLKDENQIDDPDFMRYRSIKELCENWEDVPEKPKGSALDLMILTLTIIENEPDEDMVDLEDCKQMLEKLKAWKRLKDFGCGFILDDNFTVKFVGPDAREITSAEEQKSLSDAYKLLFGGEE